MHKNTNLSSAESQEAAARRRLMTSDHQTKIKVPLALLCLKSQKCIEKKESILY